MIPNNIDDIHTLRYEDLDKTKKYMIIGVRKSGTQSMYQKMITDGFDVEIFEGRFTIPEFASTHDYSRIPIVVIRDYVERAWSDYQYFKDYDPPINPNGLDDALEPSRYKKYLKLWKTPLIFTLGYLKTLDGFPRINTNINKSDLDKTKIDYILTKLNENIE